MYDQFTQRFPPTNRVAGAKPPTWAHRLQGVSRDFVLAYCGTTFSGGLYRLHTSETSERVIPQIREGFVTEVPPRPFGFDWLGRQFALDHRDIVVMYVPGSGDILDIGADLLTFHEQEAVLNGAQALATDFFESWRASDHGQPLDYSTCVGYRVPLFLGGDDAIANTQVIDIDVYWEVSAQLLRQVRGLSPGTPVTVRLEDLWKH